MRSVVLGSSGFIGSSVVDELVARGHDVLAVDRSAPFVARTEPVTRAQGDVRDRDALRELFDGADAVYHFAASLGTSELDSELRASVETNVIGALNVFEAAVAAHVPRVFFASKAHVWLNAYTITKHTAEQMARLFSHQHPVRICALRYFNVFGPGQKLAPVRKVLPTFAAQAMRGLPIQVYGDGEQTVDMLYVHDAARITVDYLDAGYVDRALDCGTGVPMTVNDLATAVNEHFGNGAGIEHALMRKGETPGTRLVADPGPLVDQIGPLPLTDWSEALKTSLEYYAQLDPHAIDAALSFHALAQPFDGSWRS